MKIIKALAPLFVLALLFSACPNPTSHKSDAKNLVSFKFEAAKNTGVLTADAAATYDDTSSKWKIGPLPAGTNVGALVATFEISALAKATVGGTAQVSATTANNFGSDVVYTVTAEDGTTATYTIAVSVTIPKTAKEITAFSVSINTVTYTGVITEVASPGPSTIAVHIPSGIVIPSQLAATFILSDSTASAKIGTTAQVSGTTTNSYATYQDFVVTAQDNSTTTYRVTVANNPVRASIVEFCPSYSSVYAQSSKAWLDIKIFDKNALGTGWKLKSANDSYTNSLLDSSLTTVIPAAVLTALANNDTIRIHEKGYTAVDTATMTDNSSNAGVWDLATDSSYLLNYKHGILWIELADGTIADIVAYKTSTNTGAWLTTPLATLTSAVAAGQWPSDTIENAVDIGDPNSFNGRLQDSLITANTDGNRAADWRGYQSPLANLSQQLISPAWTQVTSSAGATVTFSVKLAKYGAVTVNSVSINLAAIGGQAAEALYDDGTHGDATSGDGTYTLAYSIPASTVVETSNTITFTASVSSTPSLTVSPVSTAFVLSPNAPPSPKLLLANGDMEATIAATTQNAIVGYASTTGHSGTSTNAMHIAGTLSSNSTVLLTTNPCDAKGAGYSKVTFWIKTDAATIPKAINLEFGNVTSNVPVGQLFQLVTDYATAPTFSSASGTSFLYTTTATASTGGSWVKVTLTIASTDTAKTLLIRLGSGAYDFWLDDIMLEP